MTAAALNVQTAACFTEISPDAELTMDVWISESLYGDIQSSDQCLTVYEAAAVIYGAEPGNAPCEKLWQSSPSHQDVFPPPPPHAFNMTRTVKSHDWCIQITLPKIRLSKM